ncbi:MAG: glycosyltransferase [Candidatus Bathyarchaeota archaeon]|nr:glycosyltransferase [Candidatus Bathyarchaeota archaeon]
MVKLSVIVPAYNEANYIHKMLISFKKQTFNDFEIIVKDGESSDRTVELAKKYADKIIPSKDISVSDARNQGANYADGDVLVFVDADTVLPPNMLQRIFDLMENEKIVGGSCRKIPGNKNVLDRLVYEFVNLSTHLSVYLHLGGAHGNCLFIRKNIFKKIGGFNPKIQIAEEQELVRKAMKFGKFVFLLDQHVVEHPRRIQKWGRLKLYTTWLNGTLRSFKVHEKQVYEKVR